MQERQQSHIISSYFAPRGRKRMYALGMQLAQLYLSPFDKLIGIIGDAGSGKSALIRGMFPNLELTNDDDGLYVRPLPLLDVEEARGFFSPHSYHVDIRFETGFTQLSDLADAILIAIKHGKRVIVEHFELVYPLLGGRNADLLIGVGEEVVMTRPTILGPEPDEIRDVVYQSLPYRLMVHSAEDLCEIFLPPEDLARLGHDDVRHGFVLTFPERPPQVDLRE
ncbi:MAG: alanine-tRNA synthetase second additional domain-containing protein, partial [Oscillospiraceae bacterium]|nr:alanine-tRNA synthetase second additional domain-containing protein [Oscillospiraceae bacterium]